MRTGSQTSRNVDTQTDTRHLDRLDIAILRSLFLDVNNCPARSEIHESLSSIARKLDLSEVALRCRVNGLTRSGFLKGWSVFLNPNAIGQRVAQVHLDVLPPSSKQNVIRKIRLVDGVWMVIDYLENTLAVGIYYEDESSFRNRVELMSRIANAEHVLYGETPFPSCNHKFTQADLAIIRGVQGEPWQTYASIACQAGLSARTVRRRLNRMIDERALFITPKLDFRRLKGIAVDLFVFCDDKELARNAEKKILSLYGDRIVAAMLGGPKHLCISLVFDNVSERNEILSRVRQLQGVRKTYAELIEERLEQYQTFKNQIERLSRGREKGLPIPGQRP